MVVVADAFIIAPSMEGARRWDHIANDFSLARSNLDNQQRIDELMKIQSSVGQEFRRICKQIQ